MKYGEWVKTRFGTAMRRQVSNPSIYEWIFIVGGEVNAGNVRENHGVLTRFTRKFGSYKEAREWVAKMRNAEIAAGRGHLCFCDALVDMDSQYPQDGEVFWVDYKGTLSKFKAMAGGKIKPEGAEFSFRRPWALTKVLPYTYKVGNGIHFRVDGQWLTTNE